MDKRSTTLILTVVTLGVAMAAVISTARPSAGQGVQYRAPRSPYGDGVPNLNGVWQALNTANWDIQDHSARPAAVSASGAWGAAPPGQGIVEGNEIPCTAQALSEK